MIVMLFGSFGGQTMTWTVNQKNIRWWCISSVPRHHQAVLTSVSCQKYRREAVDIVKEHFHIDVCLKSVPSETEGIGLVNELHTLLSNERFHLTKWISNSQKVIDSIPLSERVESVKYLLLDWAGLGTQMVCGVWHFWLQDKCKGQACTQTRNLSVVSSVYDPWGFSAPFILPAKVLLQDLCRKNLGWDDPILDKDLTRWRNWLE